MVLLVGKNYTRLSSQFLTETKEYETTICLGSSTNSYDRTGEIDQKSDLVPSENEVLSTLEFFQGTYMQHPPMFSAKKIGGKKLYELARQGKEIERKYEPVEITTTFLGYDYPHVRVHIRCSKGTYIRSIAHDLGKRLGCYAHVSDLRRVKSGGFSISQCVTVEEIKEGKLPFIHSLEEAHLSN
jgi:tRNA pseudouridine55 synthase